MSTREKGEAPELPPSETARERDLYQYYQPESPPRIPQENVPRSSHDTNLSAFAQLATLRLNTRRALISLIDRSNQYILAEATRTLSLQSDAVHSEQDELWYGCTALPRSQALCEYALEIRPSSKLQKLSPLIINDLTEDNGFKNHPFVKRHPSLRFYAATPITTKSGFNIGTLCIMDDHPRSGLSDVEIGFLGDMATSVMTHVEMNRVKTEHRRSEKMVKGLGLFVEGRSALSEWPLDAGNNRTGKKSGSRDGRQSQSREIGYPQNGLDLDSGSSFTEYAPVSEIMDSNVTGNLRPVGTIKDYSESSSVASNLVGQETAFISTPCTPATPAITRDTSPALSIGGDQHPAGSRQSMRTSAADLQDSMLSENLKEMFSRASNIIRECIEIEGIIFLDGSVGKFGGDNDESRNVSSGSESMGSQNQDSAGSSSEEEGRAIILSSHAETTGVRPVTTNTSQLPKDAWIKGEDEKTRLCGILGSSTEDRSSIGGDKASENFHPVTEAFLQRLLRRYPRGKVFNLSEQVRTVFSTESAQFSVGDATQADSKPSKRVLRERKARESSKQTEIKCLLQILPSAHTVVLFPLWDSHRERWFAGGFAWTTRSTRVLTHAEDLNYLAAFGNNIMAEVARLDAIAADQAKSDFISSISHELRSPLHGILASVEFLQDTAVDLFQNSMIDTIERCGKTLLDTIQHVLDFAKINNFTRHTPTTRQRGRSSQQRTQPKPIGLNVDIDVSLVTEEVIDAVYAGHEFQENSSLEVSDEASGFPSEGLRRTGTDDSDTLPNYRQDHPAPKKKRLEVIVDISWRSNWNFNTQSGALRKVVMNLFGNALKYTDTGWVKVSLQSKDIAQKGSRPQQSIITITVSDSGRGISPEFLHSHLFKPFSQENSLNPGTGLGLSIVMQIISSLGGEIGVRSELGVGTEVQVSLTLTQATRPQPPVLDAKYKSSATGVRTLTSGLALGLIGLDGDSSASETHADTFAVESKLQASLDSIATQWFDMRVTSSKSLEASASDVYITNENLGHDSSRRGPVIILCSNAAVYRSYIRGTEKQSAQNNNIGLVHFVTKPCGPHKLAKALSFCLNKASRSDVDLGPRVPAVRLPSPQNLSRTSPVSSPHIGRLSPVLYREKSASLAPPGPSDQAVPAEPTENGEMRKPVLLLVDDNFINLNLLETFTKKSKYDYDTAENGLMALEAFKHTQRRHDIILMDISMPVMNGLECTRVMRKLERERGQKPAIIIALTGLASASARQEAYTNGINLFWTKPVSFKVLRNFLHEWRPEMEL